MENKDLLAKQILDGLQKQDFYDWYNGQFDNYIGGHIPTPTKEQMIKEIINLFHLDAEWIKELK